MRKSWSGFTLIEIMVAVAIVAILAAVAYPAYQESINKGRRAEGQAALQRTIQLQERNYTANATYDLKLEVLYDVPLPVRSGEGATTGRYTLTANSAVADCTDLAVCVTVAAAPEAPWIDDNCGTLTLDTRGVRGIVGGAKDVAYCWR